MLQNKRWTQRFFFERGRDEAWEGLFEGMGFPLSTIPSYFSNLSILTFLDWRLGMGEAGRLCSLGMLDVGNDGYMLVYLEGI